MKAIIVIDLNDTTLNEWDTDTSKCWTEIKVYTPVKGGAHGIGCIYANDNVELKSMPYKLPSANIMKVMSMQPGINLPRQLYTEEYEKGYNDCLNEILGGIEDE